MAFNAEKFRAEAKASGQFTDQEIEDAIKEEMSFGKGPDTKPTREDVALPSPFTQATENAVKAGVGYAGYKLGRALISNAPDDNIPPGGGKSIMDRRFELGKEPTFYTSENTNVTPAAQMEIDDPIVRNGIRKSQLEGHFGVPLPKDPALLDAFVNSYENKFGKQSTPTSTDLFSAGNIRPGEHTMGPGNAPLFDDTPLIKDELPQPPKPIQPPPTLVQKAQAQAPQAPIPDSVSPTEASTIASVSNASQSPKELKTGSGMPAMQGTAPPGTPLKKEIASIANIPSTHAFVPGGQYMDIVRNAVGQDAYTASLLKEGGYPQTPEEAYSLSRLINEKTGRIPRDVAKDLNIGLGDTTKAITQKVAGGKAIKLAGATGALILMSDLANAKTAKEKREAMRNLGEAILPPSMTATEAGAPTLPPGAYSESKKLGSPFRQMLMGVAPPSR